MSFHKSARMQEFFQWQPNIAPEGTDIQAVVGRIHDQLNGILAQYCTGNTQAEAVLARVNDRVLSIAELASREPETTAGQLHAMRIEVMASRAIADINLGMQEHENQQASLIAGLMSGNVKNVAANDNSSSDSALAA